MEPVAALEGRVASLERALRQSRLAALALGLGALVAAAAAFTLQPTPAAPTLAAQEAQTPEVVTTQRLVLTNELGIEQLALVAGTDGSFVVLDSQGGVVIRLGGDPARRIKH